MLPRPPRESPHLLRLAALISLLLGLILIATFAGGMWQGIQEEQQLTQVWSGESSHHYASPAIDPSLQHPQNGIDFAIRVPRLGYFAAVKEGISSSVLYASPGHYPETVWPGDPGTVGGPHTTSAGSISRSWRQGMRSTSRRVTLFSSRRSP